MINQRMKVLIVDDDQQALDTMRLYLEDIANVATVAGGWQAVEYVQQHPVDVIFLDINMPILDGYKTLEKFRNLKECINVPVVFVTGHQDKYTVLNSIAMGSDGYLVKPVSKEVLQQKAVEMYHKKNENFNKRTILAIDDDMAYLKVIDSYLRDAYNVVIISSAKLALDYLMKHTPDLILLDYQMPLYNGASFMNMLHKKSDGNSIPVIVLSGVIDKEVLSECYSGKPAACLAKPVKKDLLLEKIEQILNNRG